MNSLTDFGPDNKSAVTLEVGDICVAATYREGEVNIRRNIGAARVMVLDKNLAPKGALWTGEEGLVLGMAYASKGKKLYVSDASSQTVKCFSADGKMLPNCDAITGKPFGPIVVAPDESIYIGEHIFGDKFPFIGGGFIYHYSEDGVELACHKSERDPGKFGFHGVTNMALIDDGKTALYISETGLRVMRYDLENDKQLDDAFVLDGDSEQVTAGISVLADGNILLSHVYGVSLLSPTGDVLREYDIPKERGIAAIKVLADGQYFLVSNFFTGLIEKRSIETGEVVASLASEMVFTVASLVEITE